jgi:hypothetical protein
MGERIVNRDSIRAAADQFAMVGGEIWRLADKLDAEPYYLREGDWGYSGGEQLDFVQRYDGIRGDLRDFLRDGAKALTELHDVLYSVAARTVHDEEISAEDLKRIGDRFSP